MHLYDVIYIRLDYIAYYVLFKDSINKEFKQAKV